MFFLWARNLFTNCFEQFLPTGGNAKYFASEIGDKNIAGITLRKYSQIN